MSIKPVSLLSVTGEDDTMNKPNSGSIETFADNSHSTIRESTISASPISIGDDDNIPVQNLIYSEDDDHVYLTTLFGSISVIFGSTANLCSDIAVCERPLIRVSNAVWNVE
jgi:hypothetical protein